MKKTILILLVFITLASCEYRAIYSSKNFAFNIIKIDKLKKDKLNFAIEKRLLIFSNNQAQKLISLEINAKKQIITVSKDKQGDPSRYEMIIELDLTITNDQDQKIKHNIRHKFGYNINSNRFKLNQYEKEIEEILINKIIDDVIKELSKI
tara:strand:- start:118 stop:570 length:453 start_codon:yes stop_codon:yes gene_type:complete